jgi:ubiquinone/menaquinone biosynthesis C-methylase UbiE
MAEAVDLAAAKARQQRVWSIGDFARIAAAQVVVGDDLCDAVDVLPGETVVDVACGSGNAAISASRRFATVTGVDYVPELLEHGRRRAAAEGLEVDFVEGDAESLPFERGAFDVVLSTFGAMFAPDQPRAAAELLRVCRAGGRIGMTNWTPDGLVGEMFRITSEYAPPPAGVEPPTRWGTEDRLEELLGGGTESIETQRRQFFFRYRSPEHWLEYFKRWFGPVRSAFEALDEAGRRAIADDLLSMMRRHNMAGDMALVAPSTYLEVVAVREG